MAVSTTIELKDYTLEHEIGRGDLTIVYRARRKSDAAIVAIKVVAPQFTFDDFFVRRFVEITRQTTRLEHPNIVQTYQANREGDTLYVVREMIEAQPLAQILENQGPLPPQRMLTIARQIAAALDYAHQKSIMHGDLSASRIYVDANDHVTVADFSQTQAMVGTSLVKQGYAVGSPEILAPERVHGQGPSRQSDLYSLGVLCYQMLNGQPPFAGSPAAVLHAQAYEQPRPLHAVNPGVSVPLSEAIGRMLSKGLELRYNTGSEFIRALTVATEGSAPVRRPSTATRPLEGLSAAQPLWKRPWLWALVAVPVIILLLVLGFLGVSAWLAWQPSFLAQSTAAATPTAATKDIAGAVSAATEPAQTTIASPTATAVLVVISTSTPLPTPTDIPPTPTVTPTPLPLPTPGPPVVADNSPFTNPILAHEITADNQPAKIGNSFAPGTPPIYLFFDYANIEPGTRWSHRWQWGDTELGVYDDVWPDNYFETGTAWVFYSPTGGFQPGPYQVTLSVEGTTVATITFVVEPGGL